MAYTSANEYLQALDQILKKNRGTRVNTLYDTASNVPDQLQTALPAPIKKKEDYTLEPDAIDQMQFDVPQVKQITQPQQREQAGANTSSFLQQLGQIYFSPEVQSYAQAEQPPTEQLTDTDGGYLGVDNKYYYNDGTVRDSSDGSAYYVGSTPGGGFLYSDGSTRRPLQEGEFFSVPKQEEYGMASVANGQYRTNLGNIRKGTMRSGKPINSFDEYLQLLSGKKLSSNDVTGGFGEYYGLPREAYNIGTDIGTGRFGSDQVSINLPFSAEVVDIKRWDGRNADSTSTPYGNSVLVRLPTGHMIRFSHLSDFGDIKIGDNINPGTMIGMTGDTGHAYGKHLDHEMYSPEGSLISTEQFFGSLKSQPEVASKLISSSDFQLGDIITPASNPKDMSSNEQPYAVGNPQDQKPAPQENIFGQIASGTSDYIEKTKPTGDYGIGVSEALRGDVKGASKEIGQTIEKINPTGAFDLGISEYLGGKPQLAQEKQKQTAETLGKNVGFLGQSFGLPEMGVSEAISQIPNMFAKPAYAAEMGKVQEAPQSNVFANALAQAGQGVSNIKNELGSFMDDNLFKKKDLATMGQKNVIGEDTSGAIASNIGEMKSEPADNRNAFFKAGGLDTYKGELNSGVTSGYRGALNTNLFKDTFYQNPDNVANVFGNTSLGKDATGKYKSYMGTQYPIKPGGDSPTIKKTEQYLGTYDGLTVDGEYWRDAFSRQGKDVNSGEGKGFQDQERRNQQTYTWEDVNPIYYENQYNKSVLDSIPEVLKSAFSFMAPKTGKTAIAGGLSSAQGLYQPVKGDATATDKFKDARSIPQIPSSNVFKPQGQIQSAPQVLGSSINKPTIPKPKPVPTQQYSAPSASMKPQGQSGGSNYSAPSKPSNSSYQGKPVYNAPSAPQPAPKSTPPSNASYQGKPVYNPPQMASKPAYSAPKPAPAPTPAPKPAAKPASQQSNVFQNLVNYLFGWR